MKKDVAEKIFKEKGIVYSPQHKKIWFSISKFERYPEMAAEGVGRAIGYLAFLMFMFSVIFTLVITCILYTEIKQYVDFIDEEISVIEYEDGILNIELGTQSNYFTIDDVTVVIDTEEIDYDKIEEYKNIIGSNSIGAIWLRDYIIIDYYGYEQNIYYQDIFSEIGFTEFNKTDLIDYLNDILQSPRTYLIYFVIELSYSFAMFFVSSLLNVLLLSIFGVLTVLIAKLRMRYRAIFNMSVYAITLSSILQLVYYLINLFTNFEIKYFDLMYSAISYICLTAAIFMIKSDVIKQQIEMIKIIKENKEKENQKQDKEEKKEEEEKNKEDETSQKKESGDKEDEKENKKDDDGISSEVEGQGSNA